jgi:hypothetical protein
LENITLKVAPEVVPAVSRELDDRAGGKSSASRHTEARQIIVQVLIKVLIKVRTDHIDADQFTDQ